MTPTTLPRPDGADGSDTPDIPSAWWDQFLDHVSGADTEAERAAFQARLASDPAFATFAQPLLTLWALPLPTPDVGPIDVAAAWDQVHQRLVTPETVAEPVPDIATPPPPSLHHARAHAPRWRRLWRPAHGWLTAGVAAVLLLLGRRLDRRYWHPVFHYHAGATAQTVTLPDHSVAVLAPGAYLGTAPSFLRGTRTVYLFGRARFAVAHDPARPFVVRVLEVRVTALGTTFTVASDTTAHVTVAVQEGKVALDFVDAAGGRHHLTVLPAEAVQSLPALTRWVTRSEALLGRAGVPPREAAHLYDALVRAAAAAAARAR